MSDAEAQRPPTDWGSVEQLGNHHISTLPRYWITRLYVALSTLTSMIVSSQEHNALTHKLINISGDQGWYVVAILSGLCMVAVVDVLVNDLMPLRYTLVTAKRFRHFIYIALALGNFCMTYVFLVGEGGWFRPLVLPFWLDGLIAAAVAFFDLFQRHRAPQ